MMRSTLQLVMRCSWIDFVLVGSKRKGRWVEVLGVPRLLLSYCDTACRNRSVSFIPALRPVSRLYGRSCHIVFVWFCRTRTATEPNWVSRNEVSRRGNDTLHQIEENIEQERTWRCPLQKKYHRLQELEPITCSIPIKIFFGQSKLGLPTFVFPRKI
jgi:hypothetical protein